MSDSHQRRTPAPDMAGCIMALYGATLLFAVLRTVYATSHVAEAIGPALVYSGVVAICGYAAAGLFQRRPWARSAGILISLVSIVCALSGFHVPETAQVPAVLLGLMGVGLLWGSGGEFVKDEAE